MPCATAWPSSLRTFHAHVPSSVSPVRSQTIWPLRVKILIRNCAVRLSKVIAMWFLELSNGSGYAMTELRFADMAARSCVSIFTRRRLTMIRGTIFFIRVFSLCIVVIVQIPGDVVFNTGEHETDWGCLHLKECRFRAESIFLFCPACLYHEQYRVGMPAD